MIGQEAEASAERERTAEIERRVPCARAGVRACVHVCVYGYTELVPQDERLHFCTCVRVLICMCCGICGVGEGFGL